MTKSEMQEIGEVIAQQWAKEEASELAIKKANSWLTKIKKAMPTVSIKFNGEK